VACSAAWALSAGAVVASAADSVVYEGFTYSDISVSGFADGTISADAAGQQKHYVLKSIDRLELEGQTDFNKAEEARKAKDWTKAAEMYSRALSSGRRALKPVMEARAIQAFDNTGRYLEAVRAFMDIYASSPTPATFALHPQQLPDASSKMLPEAADIITGRLKERVFNTPQAQQDLKALLLEIYTQSKDPRGAALTGAAPVEQPGTTAVVPGGKEPPPQNLSSVEDAFSGRKFDQVVKLAEPLLATAEGESAVRLFMMEAQAYEALNKADEAALAYLRVAVHYPNHSQAPVALLAAADLVKKTNPEGARRLYKEIVDKYPNSPAALKARTNAG